MLSAETLASSFVLRSRNSLVFAGVSEQLDILSAIQNAGKPVKDNKQSDEKEKKIQKTVIDIKKKFGKNAILKGMNLEEGATAMERNRQIGGHKE